jgi:hypothetical protein
MELNLTEWRQKLQRTLPYPFETWARDEVPGAMLKRWGHARASSAVPPLQIAKTCTMLKAYSPSGKQRTNSLSRLEYSDSGMLWPHFKVTKIDREMFGHGEIAIVGQPRHITHPFKGTFFMNSIYTFGDTFLNISWCLNIPRLLVVDSCSSRPLQSKRGIAHSYPNQRRLTDIR